MSFKIEFTGADGYVPFEGSGSDLLNFEGMTFADIQEVETGEAQESGNKTMKFTLLVADEEQYQNASPKGCRLVKVIPVTGLRKDKKPNVVGLLAVLHSAYSSEDGTDDDKALARVKALNGKDIDADALCKSFKGKRVFIDVSSRQYTNNQGQLVWTSDVRNFVTKGKHTDAKAIGAHRRPLPPGVGATTAAPVQQQQGPAAPNGAQPNSASPAGGQANTADAMSII